MKARCRKASARAGPGELGREPLEDQPRTLSVGRMPRVDARRKTAPDRVLGLPTWGHLDRELGELGRRPRCAACRRPLRGALQRRRDGLGRRVSAEGEMECAFLLVVDHEREPGVSAPADVGSCAAIDRRREQRMGEAKPRPVEFDDTRLERGHEIVRPRILSRCVEDAGRRLREGRREQHQLARSGGKHADALAEEILEAAGHRDPARIPVLRSAERPRDLQRVEGVAAGRLLHGKELRARRRRAEPVDEQRVDLCARQWPQRQDDEPHVTVGLGEQGRPRSVVSGVAQGDQHLHRLAVEASPRVLEHVDGLLVEPLEIVDRDQDGSIGRDPPQRGQERDCHRSLGGRPAPGIGQQQRDAEGVALRRRQAVQRLVDDVVEEIPEAGVGELRLGRRRAARQHPVSDRRRGRDGNAPEGRLPHSWIGD